MYFILCLLYFRLYLVESKLGLGWVDSWIIILTLTLTTHALTWSFLNTFSVYYSPRGLLLKKRQMEDAQKAGRSHLRERILEEFVGCGKGYPRFVLILDNDTTQWYRPNEGRAGMTQGHPVWRQDEHNEGLAQGHAEWRQVVQGMDGTMWGRNDVISCDSNCLYERVFKWKDFLTFSFFFSYHLSHQTSASSSITDILFFLACEQATRSRTISTICPHVSTLISKTFSTRIYSL